MERLDLPDAVVLDVLVDVRAFAPGCTVARRAQLAGENHVAPGCFRCQPIGCDRDVGHQLHVLVEASRSQPGMRASQGTEVFAHPLLAHVHAVEADLDGAVRGKQVRGLIPQAPIEVIAVGALQSLDRVAVLEERASLFEDVDPCLQVPGGGSTRCAHGIPAGHDQNRKRGRQTSRADNPLDQEPCPLFIGENFLRKFSQS